MANAFAPALRARRDALREREAGFTLIELLVVVIIIGILAAIAIPIYLGVQNNAKESATKSDLVNDKTAVVGYATSRNGDVPTGTAAQVAVLAAPYGWSQSAGNTTSFTWNVNGTGANATWCLTAVSATGSSFNISSTKPVGSGACGASSTW